MEQSPETTEPSSGYAQMSQRWITLADAGAAEAFAAGDGGLAFDPAGVELTLPLDSLAKGLDHGWRLGLLGSC